MDLSIIIVNFNSGNWLKTCLASLRNHLSDISYEICIVDNASTDPSLDCITDFSKIQVIRNAANYGFANAVNAGLLATSGEFILWLNPDAELLNGGVREILDYLKSHHETAIVGPKILNPDHSVQLSCRRFPNFSTAFFNRYSFLTKLFPKNPYSQRYLGSNLDHSKTQKVDWVSGACLFHSRRLIAEIGILDERFFMYCEDVDFCKRAQKAGKDVVFHPAAVFQHQIGVSSRQIHRRLIYERHKSIWIYYKKHFKRNVLLDLATGFGISLRMIFLWIVSWTPR